ncbi:ABC transporter ATP-binding protein [Plastorhodobacter daqingensis]|uniref:ABC transporter ATP-binding protein n=1 Tax=Plastorhodobacter daqingensis TaxID=1387281 RepID=A0ABW2UKK9_9RHOB
MHNAPAAPPAAEDHLVLEQLGKSFGTANVIPSLSLAVRKGEMVAFLGPSGCGKTTTLRMIAGLITPSRGRITIGGRDITHVPSHDRDMGLVFQSYALFPHMTVLRNVAFGLEMRKLSRSEVRARALRALEMVQLAHLADRKPRDLSGGQQQRVALARALVIEPSILLLDEPLSNLDAKLRDEMRVQIRALQQASGITAVFVTHDQVEALSMCDRIVVMKDGHIEQFGTPTEIYERPASPFVSGFVGRTNRLSGIADRHGVITIGDQQIRAASAMTGPVEVMMRPHRMRLLAAGADRPSPDDGQNSLRGVLERQTFIGDLVQYHVRVGAAEVVIEEATRRDQGGPAPGTPVDMTWQASDTFVFPASAS